MKLHIVVATLMMVAGLTLNDWMPTGLLDDIGALGNSDRRNAVRGLSVFALVGAVLLLVLQDWMSRNIGGLIALSISTLVSLLLFFAVDLYLSKQALRAAVVRQSMSNVHAPDELLGWRPAAGTTGRHEESGSFAVDYEIDPQGRKAIANRGSAQLRIFIFGDSYTFGHGVKNADTYANIMAREYLSDSTHVFNLGVMGYGIVQMFGRFLEIEAQLKRDDIVLFAPTSQDLKRNMKDFVFPSKLIFGDRVDFGKRYPYYRNGGLESVELATSWNYIKALFFNGRWSKGVFRFAHSAIVSPPTTVEAKEMIALMRRVARKRGARFLLVFLPQTKERRRNTYEEDVSSFDFRNVMRFFPTDEAELKALRFATDSHWNRAGHAVAARALVSTLLAEGLITPNQLKTSVQLSPTSEIYTEPFLKP